MTTEPAHSRFSPSSRERWSECPASIHMQEDYENVTNEAAEQGTRVHEILNALLTGRGYKSIDREEEERAKYAFGLIKELVDSYLYNELHKYRVTVFSELKVYLDEVNNSELRGTLDAAIVVDWLNSSGDKWYMQRVFVIDYKDGNVPVHVENNKQLEYYMAAFINMLESQIDTDHTVFQIGIIQPRISQGIQWEKEKYYWHLMETSRQIKEEADICETRPFTKAGEWCKYCLASGACKANAERLMELVGVDINV